MDVTGIIVLSMKVALAAVLCSLPLAFGVAWLLARTKMPGKAILQALVTMPLVIPPVVTGYLLLSWFGHNGFAGRFFENLFGITFAFRWTGAALAAGVMAFPLLVRPIRLSLDTVDTRLEDAAQTLGASPTYCFFTITLPLIAPGLFAAFVLGFAKALGEFGATITFVANIPGETQTLSLAIYSLMQSPDGDSAARTLIGISILIGFVAIISAEWVSTKLQWSSKDEHH
jgi:molybdate transport system permease protein